MKATEQFFHAIQFNMLRMEERVYRKWNPKVWTFKWKQQSSQFFMLLLIPNRLGHSNESYWAILFRGAVYYAAQDGSNCESVDEILKCDHMQMKANVLFIGPI